MATSPFEHGSLTLFHVRGVPIRLHWTLFLLVPYLMLVIAAQFQAFARIAGMEQVHLVLPPLVWGGLLAIGLFASIAVHELAHTFVAMHYGGRVRAITLMLLGGVSEAVRMPRRPRHEALMALAGPATSIGLGLFLGLLRYAAIGMPDDVSLGLFYLSWMNLVLGFFNLLPAFPMDGGRILRAVLAGGLGRERATWIATAVGRLIAVAMGILGLWASDFLLVLIAAFIYFGARTELLADRVRAALEGMRAADLVPASWRPPVAISANESLASALARMREIARLELVVIDSNGLPVGVLEAKNLALVPREDRDLIRAGEHIRAQPARHVVVPWDTNANDAMTAAGEAGARHVIVVDPRLPAGQQLLGLVSPADIETTIALHTIESDHTLLSRARFASR